MIIVLKFLRYVLIDFLMPHDLVMTLTLSHQNEGKITFRDAKGAKLFGFDMDEGMINSLADSVPKMASAYREKKDQREAFGLQ
jgi:hypothetical protein